MRRTCNYLFSLLTLILLSSSVLLAQTIVTGKVLDGESGDPLIGANVVVKGTVSGTITNVEGKFRLQTTSALPFNLVISVVGYQTTEVAITENNQDVNVTLKVSTIMGQEVVISASRVEENILQSPVSIERLDIVSIRETPAASFYDALQNLKGVEMSTQSLTFRSVNTRGFNANGNVRVVQMIDGMDNQAPGLNFSVGNIAGISELDLEGVELLPGAASALYGPNAINGIVLMTSKSPFQYQGLSAQVKSGIMSESSREQANTPFYDMSIRYAKAINNKLAFKVNASYLRAQDWEANDFRDQSVLNGFNPQTGTRENNPGFNGVNIYGDETNVNMFTSLFGNGTPGPGAPFLGLIATQPVFQGQTLPQLTGLSPQQLLGQMIPNQFISRTGYAERDLADYNTYSLKLNGALHYRFSDKVEGILQVNYGRGTTVYTGADRYSIANFYLSQIKSEIRGSNFFVRAYTTLENSGDAFATGITGQGINEAWKPSTTWFPQYFQTFGGASFQSYATAFLTAIGQGADNATAIQAAQNAVSGNFGAFHGAARAAADTGRLLPGTPEFQAAADAVNSRPIPGNAQGVGARFTDKTNLYHTEFMYNFKNQIDPSVIEIIVGGNYRIYALNSEGTLFATDDNGDEFNINEFGGYVQLQKRLFEERLKLTGSMRYDKNENFKGQFSPRVSAVLTVAKTHNLRASFQTGFRIPTTQDQFIDLNTPQARLVGGLPLFRERYNMINNPVYTLQSVQAFGAALQQGVAPGQAAQLLQVFQFPDFEPERVQSYEVGYKSLIGEKLLIDAYYYYNNFRNFLGGQVVVQDRADEPTPAPLSLLSANTRNVFSFPVNSTENLRNHGWALGADYMLPRGFTIGGNVSYNALIGEDQLPEGFETSFNTPNYRYVLNFANRNLVKNLSFAVSYRWQDEFVWQSSFVGPVIRGRNESVVPAFSTLDAQVSLKIPKMKSIVKVGGSNILNQGYIQAWGNPTVGGMYYISILFDEFLN
jgi:outer membrane receptor protein involved in Fe transport